MTRPGESKTVTPGTFVQLGPTPDRQDLLHNFGTRPPADHEMAPELALVLAAVLLAAAEQVSRKKLAQFRVSSPEDLSIFQLAMAFRGDDTGLVGDVFEWSLLLALNGGDPGVTQLVIDALLLSNLPVDQPQAVLVAAESGRLVTFSPELPPRATLVTGRRGRPPHVANLLDSADPRSWKADLLLGSGEKWVTASLKSNPRDLKRSLRVAADTPHAPRIGITASHNPGLTRDPETGAVLVHVPVHGPAMALSKVVLADVREAFSRDLSLPTTPLQQDVTSIGRQLDRWQDHTVRDVANMLLQWGGSRGRPSWNPLFRWSPMETGASVPDARGALIAVNTLVDEDRWGDRDKSPVHAIIARKFGAFDPID